VNVAVTALYKSSYLDITSFLAVKQIIYNSAVLGSNETAERGQQQSIL